MRIDAHNHFWQYDPVIHAWIDEGMRTIRRDFLPEDFQAILAESGISGTVAVQADQSMKETHFLLEMASRYDIIKGVVGWVDLQADDLEQQLEAISSNKHLVGIRHIVQAEPDPEFMLGTKVQTGLKKLSGFGMTYDLLIFPHQLHQAIQTVRNLPDQAFVLDHIAKPYIKEGKMDAWKGEMHKLALSDNVMCKLSGMVTEADWQNWKEEDFTPYLDVVVEAFGPERVMFGSDWPVCKLAADYEQVLGLLDSYFRDFSVTEREKIFGGNAIQFYGLKV